MSSKTDVSKRADAKKKERFYVGTKEVKPVKMGRRMWWATEDGLYFSKWTEKR